MKKQTHARNQPVTPPGPKTWGTMTRTEKDVFEMSVKWGNKTLKDCSRSELMAAIMHLGGQVVLASERIQEVEGKIIHWNKLWAWIKSWIPKRKSTVERIDEATRSVRAVAGGGGSDNGSPVNLKIDGRQ